MKAPFIILFSLSRVLCDSADDRKCLKCFPLASFTGLSLDLKGHLAAITTLGGRKCAVCERNASRCFYQKGQNTGERECGRIFPGRVLNSKTSKGMTQPSKLKPCSTLLTAPSLHLP